MRKLDWFLAAIVATFLLAVAAIETTNVAVGAVGLGAGNADGVGEVAVRRLVSHVPRPPMLRIDPQ